LIDFIEKPPISEFTKIVLGSRQVGNMRSMDIPYVEKGKLRAFLKNPLQEKKKLGNCST
jgi:hypothetical protein